MAGINKDVQVLGLTFHVQTEVLTTNVPTVHTVVFRAGRAVAATDCEVSAAEIAEKGERALVYEQQDRVIASLTERAKRYQEKQSQAAAEVESKLDPEPVKVASEPVPAVTEAPSTEPIAAVLRIRRMLGELRQRLGIERAEAHLTPSVRIEHAARCLDWSLEHRLFTELRVFEQVQFHVIRTRISRWSATGSQLAQAEEIWSEIIAFLDHLAEINHRKDLRTFDRELLTWGISQIEDHGLSAETGDRLRELSGLDTELDLFLGGPASDDRDRWLGALCPALERLAEA